MSSNILVFSKLQFIVDIYLMSVVEFAQTCLKNIISLFRNSTRKKNLIRCKYSFKMSLYANYFGTVSEIGAHFLFMNECVVKSSEIEVPYIQ